MWLIYQENDGVLNSLNMDNVAKMICDIEEKTILFYGSSVDASDEDSLMLIDLLEFADGKEANSVYTAILQEIAIGNKVFEIKFDLVSTQKAPGESKNGIIYN